MCKSDGWKTPYLIFLVPSFFCPVVVYVDVNKQILRWPFNSHFASHRRNDLCMTRTQANLFMALLFSLSLAIFVSLFNESRICVLLVYMHLLGEKSSCTYVSPNAVFLVVRVFSFVFIHLFLSATEWTNLFTCVIFFASFSLSPSHRLPESLLYEFRLKRSGVWSVCFHIFFVLFIRSFVSETLQWVSVCALAPELLHIENEFSSMLYINDRKSRLAQTNNVWTKKHSLSHTHMLNVCTNDF